jgi:hypothetical protein
MIDDVQTQRDHPIAPSGEPVGGRGELRDIGRPAAERLVALVPASECHKVVSLKRHIERAA